MWSLVSRFAVAPSVPAPWLSRVVSVVVVVVSRLVVSWVTFAVGTGADPLCCLLKGVRKQKKNSTEEPAGGAVG